MIIIYLTSYMTSYLTSYFTIYFTSSLKSNLTSYVNSYLTCGLVQHFQHLGHSFFTKRTDSKPANNSSLSQINFFILSLPPVVQIQQTNRGCKEEFFHFNIATKICLKRKLLTFNFLVQ